MRLEKWQGGIVLLALMTIGARSGASQSPQVAVVSSSEGLRLEVDGQPFMIRGMNWDYFPVGTNYAYSFWSQSDDMISSALDREMTLLRAMGVNAIRVYAGIPPRWVQHIYERYGIFSVINHPVGRYGTTVNGVYAANTNYSDPRTRAALVREVSDLVDSFDGVPGVLMWLLGNENNYGLAWQSAETQALPVDARDRVRARHLYSLLGEVTRAVKARDAHHPVSIANGDVQYIDIIAEELKELDVFGANVYRGRSARDLFEVVRDRLGIPVMLTEFGADAYDARRLREDQLTQARYLLAQWQEIYEQSAGKGRVGNAIGGFTFQWSDGWWKFGQEDRLAVHDIRASWPNDAYPEDFAAGQNNMNEEWWGITAKGPADAHGLYTLYPRAAYYALKQAYTLDPYAPSTDLQTIRAHFGGVDPAAALLQARGDLAAMEAATLSRVRLADLRAELETYSTGGSRISTPESQSTAGGSFPAFQGFDTKQSIYATVAVEPAPNLVGSVSLNVLGNVPTNPIDEIFYENRGRMRRVLTSAGSYDLRGIERVAVYGASVRWEEPWFELDGFYRTGHYHWGFEGDFFNLYREANYGRNLDIYNGLAPYGFEIDGRRSLDGVTLAFGPELWWGANPSVMAKVRRQLGPLNATLVAQEDIARKEDIAASFAVPLPPTRKVALSVATGWRGMGLELGGIWSGSPRVGERFQLIEGAPGSYRVLQDNIQDEDALGAKGKVTYSRGRWNWYAQSAIMGLVAEAGPTQTLTYTGWSLRESGSGNQYNVLTGLTYLAGNFQIAPNFLWQKPIVGPIPGDVPVPGRSRNILDDPFAVRANRETVGGELLLTYDPTPATWMYAWDSDAREDAPLAASIGFVYRHLPTTQDAAIGILGDGRTTFAFPGAPPARDLWEVRARIIAKRRADFGMIFNLFGGTAEPNGDDERLVRRLGGEVVAIRGPGRFGVSARVNDWGPYDYHRDFNLTFPLQLGADLSYTLGVPSWLDIAQSRVGLRGTWRSLDEYSPRYCPVRTASGDDRGVLMCNPSLPGPAGEEWEIRSYLHFSL
jgi:hypothetical protein